MLMALKSSDGTHKVLLEELDNKTVELSPHDVSIAGKLSNAGLDPKHWLPIFKRQLGVTSPQALSDVGNESYTDLQRFTQKPGEKKALRKFLGLKGGDEGTNNCQRSQQREKFTRRYERATDILQRLKGQQKEGKSRQDRSVQILENGIREALQIPIDSWIPQDTALESVTGGLETYIDQVHAIFERRELPDLSVVQNASDGLALRGILLSSNLEDQLDKQEKLLQAPKDVELKMPFLSQSDEIVDFSSKSKEDQFIRSVETLGYSLTASATNGFGGFRDETASPHGIFENGTTTEDHQEKQYASKVKFSFVPFASSYFSSNQLFISDDALENLKTIERLITSNAPESTVYGQCTQFLQRYGSHANKGCLHLGGIYWKKEVYPVKATSDATVDVTFKQLGAPEVSCKGLALSMSEWKAGLMASNSTWSVIDRGTTTVPVWDIIQMNHTKDFEMPEILIQTLKESWEEMTSVRIDTAVHQLVEKDEDVDLLLDSIKADKDLSQCEKHLERMLAVKENVVRESRSLNVWPDLYLSQVSVQDYLTAIMESGRESDSEHIKHVMKQLVCPSHVQSIKGLNKVFKWLYHADVNPEGALLKCADLMSLKILLQQVKDDMITAEAESTMYAESAEQQGVRIIATATVTRAINHIRDNFSEAKYEELFLLTLLFPLKYDVNEKIFLHPLSVCGLEYLHQKLDEQSEELYKIVYEPLMNLQSYLFHLAAKVHGTENDDLDISEAQIEIHLQYMQKKLQSDSELDPQVDRVLSQFSTDRDWNKLQSELESLIEDKSMLWRDEVRLLKALTVTPENEQMNNPFLALKVQQQNEELLKGSRKVQMLFRVPGFDKYYPQKLTLKDALLIRQRSLTKFNVQCTDPKLLPLMILQKVMTSDHRCRTVLFYPKNPEPECDSSDDESLTDETAKDELRDVHPMDGLSALLHCSNSFLLQELMAKLSTCQFAIPFLLPDPFTNKLTLPLWAMHSIVKDWKCVDPNSGKTISSECPIVNHPAPIISFFRFTINKHLSKSRLLNYVISHSEHNHFFHYDCGARGTKRVIVDGLVELCWYLPACNDDDPFSEVITFTNLHGDARQHPKQTKFLSEVSFMNFVLLAANDLNERGIEVLQQLAQAPGGLVLMFHTKVKKAQEEQLRPILQQYPRIKLRNESASDVNTDIRNKINEKLTVCKQHLRTLIHCAEIARDHGIYIDEDDPECTHGKKLADELIKKLPPGDSAVKDEIFPLQGKNLWHEWAKHDKELHRQREIGSKTIEQYSAQKEEEKSKIRMKQLSLAESCSPVIHSFITNLLNNTGIVRDYFLHWLKLNFDADSRMYLSQLRFQYQEKRHQLQRGGSSDEGSVKKQIEELNEKMVNISFGLEHFFRELGQIYEAVVQQEKASPQLRAQVNRLPEAVAELLISGYPLELMDGDAAHVPMQWVMAILSKVRTQLGNVKLLVLSALGVQSSGKSTLLNAMFGVRFAVSAGRCTRGAFIQLLPLSEEMKKQANCDYVLIVDTEGLRAPEVNLLKMQKHDNEVATFVIGLANITIVNIFGETPSDMEDILQTAVHAFIRMKCVKLTPSCQFVHQNLGAVMAKDKGMISRVKFQEKLDEMTIAAATQEHCETLFKKFNDVIEFNDEKDVWHFPSLWKGNPPMAPVNPQYGEKAHTLKSDLIELAEKKGIQCSLSTFKQRINDLWKAVLYENFVFSFKNTLETIAYKHLDTIFSQWSWKFQHEMLEWEQEEENRIQNTEVQELGNLEKCISEQLSVHVLETHENLREELERFFQEDEQRDILEQWKAQTMVRLDKLREERETHTKQHCKLLISARQELARAEGMKQKYREELLYQVKQLASKLDELSEEDLEYKFNEMWIERVNEFAYGQESQVGPDIDGHLQSCLKASFVAHYFLLIERLQSNSLKDRDEETLTFCVKIDTHITASRRLGNLRAKVTDSHIETADRQTDKVLEKAQLYLEKKRDQNFNPGFCEELLVILRQAIDEVQSNVREFKFTPEYRVDMALTVCGYAMTVFQKMAEDFWKKNDPIEYLKREMKTPLLRLFKSQYHQSAKEKTAADNLCDILVKPIERAVIGTLSFQIVEDMKGKSSYVHSKMSLQAKVLIDLAEKDNFDDCVVHLTDVKRSLKSWIKHYTEQHCKQKKRGKSRLIVLAELKLKKLVKLIIETIKQVTQAKPFVGEPVHDITNETISDAQPNETFVPKTKLYIKQWLSNFHHKLKRHLPLDLKEMLGVVGSRVERL